MGFGLNVAAAKAALKEARANEKYHRDRIRRERAETLRIEREAKERDRRHHDAVLKALQPFLRPGVSIEYDVTGNALLLKMGPNGPEVCFSAGGGDGTTYLDVRID